MSNISQKPFLVRAIWEWCNASGYTPYIGVFVSETVKVPPWVVHDGMVTLNIGPLATNQLYIGDDFITFQARFSGAVQDIIVPIANVTAIFAKENEEGLKFAVTAEQIKYSDQQILSGETAPQTNEAPSKSASKNNSKMSKINRFQVLKGGSQAGGSQPGSSESSSSESTGHTGSARSNNIVSIVKDDPKKGE